MRLLLSLLLVVFSFGWSVTVISYGGDVRVYNGSLLLAEGRAFAPVSLYVPHGWVLRVVVGNLSLPVDVVGDVFVVVGAPAGGCEVFHFYSVALDETYAVFVCSEATSAVLGTGGMRSAMLFEEGVSVVALSGRQTVSLLSSDRPVRVRGDVVVTAFQPAVMSGLPLRGGSWRAEVYNASVLLGRVYNLSSALAAVRRDCDERVRELSGQISALRGELAALRAERDRLAVLGPNAIALYASLAVGVAAGVAGALYAWRRSRGASFSVVEE